MTRTVAIVQARAGSTRLPGKVLMDLCGHTVLEHVLTRCAAIGNVDQVCCAVPDETASEPIEQIARECDAVVVRGSEADVLDRYLQAARTTQADVILRVTSDCPLIDPGVCADVVALRADRDADFACNNEPPAWPHGLDCEVVTREWLERAAREATAPYDREHVCPYVRRHPEVALANLEGPGGAAREQRWTLDFPEDLDFFRALFELLPSWPEIPSWRTVFDIVSARPDIAEINSRHHVVRGESADSPA